VAGVSAGRRLERLEPGVHLPVIGNSIRECPSQQLTLHRHTHAVPHLRPENGGAGERNHTRAAGRAAKDQANCGSGVPRGEQAVGLSATYRVDVAIHVLL
jgi:hypothetical protein